MYRESLSIQKSLSVNVNKNIFIRNNALRGIQALSFFLYPLIKGDDKKEVAMAWVLSYADRENMYKPKKGRYIVVRISESEYLEFRLYCKANKKSMSVTIRDCMKKCIDKNKSCMRR